MPLRIAPGQIEVTVRSAVKQPGGVRFAIDYDMEKTTAGGWRVYDIKIAGVSLIATYRSVFARTIRDDGVDELIRSLSAGNPQADSGLNPQESSGEPFLFTYVFMHAIMAGVLRSVR